MEAYRQEIILASVGFYMALCILVGIWAMRRTSSAGDFFVAGRGLGPWVVSLAVFSSTLSGFGFVGGPGLVYATGLSSVWMVVISSLGFGVGFILISKRIRMIAEVRDTISLPDVFTARYGSESIRFLTALVILLGVMGYLATQILAMSTVLQQILNGTETFQGISLIACAVISVAVLLFYSVTGGIVASVYTDVVQGGVMAVAGLLVVFAAADVFDGGMAGASQLLFETDPEAILPFGTLGAMVSLGWVFMFGFGLAGQPHVVTKMMMNRRIADNRIILPVTLIGYALSAMLWISIGVVMRALVIGDIDVPLLSADAAAPEFLSTYAHPLLAGVVFAGLFAAIMSTADGFLNIGAAAIIHDMPKAITGRALVHELFWARLATVGLTILAAGFALYSFYVDGALVALLGAFGWGTFAAAIVPPLVFGLIWKGATATAGVASITVSLLVNVILRSFGFQLPYSIDLGVLALLLSMIIFLGVSLAMKPKPLPYDMDRILDL